MKKLLFIFALALGFTQTSQAQTSTVSAQNADAVKNYDGVAGRFDYSLSATERVNVNYALTPKKPTTVAHFMIHTPDPMPFSATVSDASGKIVLTWKPETKVYLYNADWNVSSLAAGNYTVHIYMGTDTKSIYQFSFNK